MATRAFETVLTPLDGSPFAEEALPLAIQVVRRSGARLELARVVVSTDPVIRRGGERYLNSLRDQLAQGVDGAVLAKLLDGEIVPALASRINEVGADLVVLTTHARGPIGRLCLGSVADQLLRTTRVPLLLMPPRAPGPVALRQIALPLDRSPRAESIIPFVRRLGKLFGASYLLYHNLPPWTPLIDPTGMSALPPDPATDAAERRDASSYLDGIAQRMRSDGAEVACFVDGAPVTALGILQLPITRNINLIALTRQHHGELERLMADSLLDRILRGSSVPILVTPSD